jgi:hypothetical protein
MENNDEEEQQQTDVIETSPVESRAGSTDPATKVEQPQATSLIQSLLLEQNEEKDDKKKKKKKKIKTSRQKELVSIYIITKVLYF